MSSDEAIDSGTRQNVCTHLLAEGYVHAYLSLFDLLHRTPVVVDPITERTFSIPLSRLQFIIDHLCMAELARRRGNFREFVDTMREISDYFESEGDKSTALEYVQHTADVCRSCGDVSLECDIELMLGQVYERIDDMEQALFSYEKASSMAMRINSRSVQVSVLERLFSAYWKIAERHEEKKELAEAIEAYQRALETVIQSENLSAQGEIYHRLGAVYLSALKYDDAVEAEEKYLEIARRRRDEEAEANAFGALTRIYEESGNIDKAIESVEEFRRLAEAAQNVTIVANAYFSLGHLYTRLLRMDDAVQAFENFLRTAQEIGDRKLIQKAVIQVGLARGSAHVGQYFDVVQTNIEALFRWREHRIPFAE